MDTRGNKMTKNGLTKLKNKEIFSPGEVLIHPGHSSIKERFFWNVRNQHNFYLAKERKYELSLSKKTKLKELLLSYENLAQEFKLKNK